MNQCQTANSVEKIMMGKQSGIISVKQLHIIC